jgi:XTP/dITP diphosphohydrolase
VEERPAGERPAGERPEGDAPRRLLVATRSRHKLRELGELLHLPAGVELIGPDDLGIDGEPDETGLTFETNARIKARYYAARSGLPTLADDSGLEVEALGWAPGVTSARYAGVDGPGADRANYERLLGELRGLAGPLARRARFVCSVVAVTPNMKHYAATGHWWGSIADAPRGEGGFGYDPVFVPEGSDLTVAEWPQDAKDQASHRALAGRALVDVLRREGLLHGQEGSTG